MDGQSGLARRLGSIDLYDASAREAAHAEGVVEAHRSGRYHVYILDIVVAELHYGPLAIILLDLLHCGSEGVEACLLGVYGLFIFF